MAEYSLEQIQAFWTEQAREHGQSPAASWTDRMAIELEIREILKHLQDGDRVLDVGCGNGYSTVQFAFHKQVHILGLDYIPEMIEQARARLRQVETSLRGRVGFERGDITALALPSAGYDKVVAIRVMINLGDWTRQIEGLRECTRVLRPGGMLLLSEATLQGWNRLNSFRREWGLPDIPMPPFNQYLDEDRVADALAGELELLAIDNFASTYYVGTRVLKPLLIQALSANVEAANPDMHWNRWFSQLPAAGDYGTQKLFRFRKK